MREIKFRAWDKKEKRFREMEFVQSNFDKFGDLEVCTPDNNEWDRLILIQFTGLEDKNGKEIYEGDILKEDYSDDEGEDWVIILIEMEHFADCGYREIKSKKGNIYDIRLHRPERFEVIGNKFENPELLK